MNKEDTALELCHKRYEKGSLGHKLKKNLSFIGVVIQMLKTESREDVFTKLNQKSCGKSFYGLH